MNGFSASSISATEISIEVNYYVNNTMSISSDPKVTGRRLSNVKREIDSYKQTEIDLAYAAGKYPQERLETVAAKNRQRLKRTTSAYQKDKRLRARLKWYFLCLATSICRAIHFHPLRLLRKGRHF